MKFVARMIGAVLLGVGTIFGLKSDPEAHWSEPPDWVISAEEASERDDSGGTT